MKKLKQGYRVKLLPYEELLELFNQRGFFFPENREEFARTLSSQEGEVTTITDKYEFDYFYFKMDDGQYFSMPYQSIDFSHNAKVIHDLKDIDTSIPEGRLLFAALAKITTESQTDKTPYEVIEQLNKLAGDIESANNAKNNQSDTL